jgi:hypothetical protein
VDVCFATSAWANPSATPYDAAVCEQKKIIFGWPMNTWCFDSITDMSYLLFHGKYSFDEYISEWDVSKVTNMQGMFWLASAFNQPIGGWNVLKVVDMSNMFFNASSFNQSLCKWKYSFPYSNAVDIFKESGCTYKSDPDPSTMSPFCALTCPVIDEIHIIDVSLNCFCVTHECMLIRHSCNIGKRQYWRESIGK